MTDNTDVLSNAELPAVRFLLGFCSRFGPAAGPLNADQWRACCGALSSLDAAYAEIENSTFKAFVDQYLKLLMDVPSQAVPGVSLFFKHLYVVYAYSVGCKIGDNFMQGFRGGVWPDAYSYLHVRSDTWKDMWDLFANGYDWIYEDSRIGTWAAMNTAQYIPIIFEFATVPSVDPITTWRDGFTNDVLQAWASQWSGFSDDDKRLVADHAKTVVRRPTSPVWKQATDDIMQAWAAAPPPEVIHRASGPVISTPDNTFPNLAITDGNDAVNAAEGVLAKWTDFPAVQAATAPAWGGTLTDEAKALLRDSSALSGDQYFFLLHLLIALACGDADSARLAHTIAYAHAPSKEYDKDFFINQLIYLVLMNLADPLGSANTHAQLQQFVSDCAGILPASDAGKLIATALAPQVKILQADTSYPLQDAYAAIDAQFYARKTDTADALDAARKTIAGSLP
jgi:hypothetical protein